MLLNAEDFKTVVFHDGEKARFPVHISIEDVTENNVAQKYITVTWIDEAGYLVFKTAHIGQAILEKKLSGGIIA